MKIHFVCSGNTFRSRLAEGYLKSKNINNLIVSSSGIKAAENFNGPIAPHTVWVSEKYNLSTHMFETWRESDKNEIEDQDLVIFMEPLHYKYCTEQLHCNIP